MIVVFAGAGASKAVNAAAYPSTVEFFQRIPDAIRSDPLFGHAVEYLKATTAQSGQIDIEQVLWLTKSLKDFSVTVSDPASVPGWFLDSNRLAAVLGLSNADFRPVTAAGRTTSKRIDALSSRIYALVYELYKVPPSMEDLASNWTPLLNATAMTGEPTEIITTNYDIVIEEAIRHLRAPVLTGRRMDTQPTLDTTLWNLGNDSAEPLNSMGRLTKLHGSIDWVRDGGRIFVGTPTFQGDHARHAIIYPGFKGVPTDPLFQQFHAYFRDRISKARVIIFVGYAFRDEHINDLLERNIGRDTTICVLNPANRLPSMPFAEARVKHIPMGFDAAAVESVLTHLTPSVSPLPTPGE